MNPTQKPLILNGVELRSMNTFGVSSVAPLFSEIKSVEELHFLREKGFFDHSLPFVLGGGSNVLFSEKLTRPILKAGMKGVKILSARDGIVRVEVQAGEQWPALVEWAVQKNLGGLENLALIPGTAGAAPIQNIGAYGVELKDLFESLNWTGFSNFSERTFTAEECAFGYRDSIFKQELKGAGIVTSIVLRLTRENHTLNYHYKPLREYLEQRGELKPDIRRIFEAVVSVRQSKLPDPAVTGNAGSFFKNPMISEKQFNEIAELYPEVPGYPDESGFVKVPAAWLIEKAGWKGKRAGETGTWDKQALVIVNHGRAGASEILDFATGIQKDIKEKFGIDLSPEVNVIR
ncbi:MAG: UDP-N-acetylmuramate dehydrogenase [Balneolaceae bacterium]|nr:MAG: UDP-N-acetylmuramate dehydrogenase [Balneolaceae bacterium]